MPSRSSLSGRRPPRGHNPPSTAHQPAAGVFAAATGAKPVALLREVALEDRLDHVDNRRLNHAVADGGYPQRTRLNRFRVLGCEHVESTGADTCRASIGSRSPRASPGALAQIDPPRRDRPRPRLAWTPPVGTPPGGSVPRRPCQTAETTSLPPLPVRESPTCGRSRPTV